MNIRTLVLGAAVAASTLGAIPAAAQAHGYRDGYYREADYRAERSAPYRYESGRARRGCRTSGTTGLIVGGAAGALLGRQMDGGRDRATGTLLGAGAGALLGREISRKHRC